MRKVTAGLFHSIDGVVESPNLFQFDSFDDDLGALLGKVIAATDAVILGRVGYEAWAGYWPKATADGDFATFINGVPKYVASRTLRGPLVWQNASLIDGDLDTFVRGLKGRAGGEIAVMGGISLVRHLFFAGLLDELTLITHPAIAGTGRRLFEPTDRATRLELVESIKTRKGNLVSTYRRRA